MTVHIRGRRLAPVLVFRNPKLAAAFNQDLACAAFAFRPILRKLLRAFEIAPDDLRCWRKFWDTMLRAKS